jgi:hypothetical protein
MVHIGIPVNWDDCRATGTRPAPSGAERRVQSRIRDLGLPCGLADRDAGQDAS